MNDIRGKEENRLTSRITTSAGIPATFFKILIRCRVPLKSFCSFGVRIEQDKTPKFFSCERYCKTNRRTWKFKLGALKSCELVAHNVLTILFRLERFLLHSVQYLKFGCGNRRVEKLRPFFLRNMKLISIELCWHEWKSSLKAVKTKGEGECCPSCLGFSQTGHEGCLNSLKTKKHFLFITSLWSFRTQVVLGTMRDITLCRDLNISWDRKTSTYGK